LSQSKAFEIDGGIHDEADQKEYDIGRTVELQQFGITLIRFQNDEVINNVEAVLGQILIVLRKPKSCSNLSRGAPFRESEGKRLR